MAENNPPSPPSLPKPSPEITLPPRTSIENIFTTGQGASPDETTLATKFFPENDPDDGYRSFSQLLSGDMSYSSSAPSVNHNFEPPVETAAGDVYVSAEIRSQQNRPGGLVGSQLQGMFTIPPGLSSESLLDSPSFLSSTQLLSGDMSSPSALSVNPNFEPTVETGGGGGEFSLQQNWPGGLEVLQPRGMLSMPPGLSRASLLDSPSFPSSMQLLPGDMSSLSSAPSVSFEPTVETWGGGGGIGEFMFQQNWPGMSAIPPVPLFSNHQQMLAQVEMQYTLPSGAPPQQQQISPPIPNPKITKESSNISHSDKKPPDDGYNYRNFGQKLVQGSGVPTGYYKCTDPNCLVKKKVERSNDGQITGIIYAGEHKHPPPSKRHGNANRQGKSGFGSEWQFGNFGKEEGGQDQGSSQVTPEDISGSSDREEVGNGETRLDGRDEDEPASKRRFVEVQSSKEAPPRCTELKPRVNIIQATSEVGIIDDGYKWRKYGQKPVKDNPHPRRYYKCTSPYCDARKQIQRVADDPKAVTITYRGKHNHDKPASKNSSQQTDAK